MGKKGKQQSSSTTSKNTPKCTCEDPYKCSCGNRPERPSKGHKWDPEKQEWGGKGHRQKGASGTAAVVGSGPIVTERGKTTLAQWQKLPSFILNDICKKDKRPPPKYKEIDSQGGKFRYRVIVQDAKATKRGGEHDLIFLPVSCVKNEEQAKEEAALLALLHLTPKLPHERTLPEPYKTTWLNALQAINNDKTTTKTIPNQDKSGKSSSTSKNITSTNETDYSVATASNLVNANKFISLGEKRKQMAEKKRARIAKIRRHEAIRMANKDMQVFMSANLRKQVEILLRGDADEELMGILMKENDDSLIEEEDSGESDDIVKTYVIQRLKHEGFTSGQANAGYAAILKNPTVALKSSMNGDEDMYMDNFYEECLQWLCVHLNEDQLPEGFDPRGRTLDVIVAPKTSRPSQRNAASESHIEDTKFPDDVNLVIRLLGVSNAEAACLYKLPERKMKDVFWKALCALNKIDVSIFEGDNKSNNGDLANNKVMAEDEIEVLRAMYPEENDLCVTTFTNDAGRSRTELTIRLFPDDDDFDCHQLCIQYDNNSYPQSFPKVFIIGGWANEQAGLGTRVHSELITFISNLPASEPMIFEVLNHAHELVRSGLENNARDTMHNGSESTLLPYLNGSSQSNLGKGQNHSEDIKDRSSRRLHQKFAQVPSFHPRPRTKNTFWSKKPNETPPAKGLPTISTTLKNARENLPAAQARESFLRLMKEADQGDRVVLITGETGCGKTTQIPQYILEDAPSYAKIVVAQPRRLAATGVADRVANERGESKPGVGTVGYVVRGDSKMSDQCRLMFCTTGVLLRQLQSEGALDCVTHIVIDEVHERHLDTDVLLAILKETRPRHLRVVLMSATMDADRFAAYWGDNTPRMHIPGFTYPVKDFFLEDVLRITGYIPPKKGKKGYLKNKSVNISRFEANELNDSEYSEEDEVIQGRNPNEESTIKSYSIDELVKRVDSSNIDYDMLGTLVSHLVQSEDNDDDGSILIFLPGAPEIDKAHNTLLRMTKGKNMNILPLHGGLQPQDQKKVFDSSTFGFTKVILSTNVAETSITIPDCTLVIDTAREKQSSYDPSNRMPLLVEKYASQDSLKQRRGRAGRVRPGSCYKLISRETLSKLPQHGEPEIKRSVLDQTLLSLVFLGIEDGSGNFLSKLIDPPCRDALDSAIFSLDKIGAIVTTYKSECKNITLTPLGLHLAGIPAPPSIGKLLVMGALLGCRSAALAIAAGLSTGKSPFLKIDNRYTQRNSENNDFNQNESVLQERKKLSNVVGNSDHAMLAAIFMEWNSLTGGHGLKRKYLNSLGLSAPAMHDMQQLVQQYDSALCNAGFGHTKDSDANSKSWRIIRSCIVSALAPSQIVR